MATHCSMLLLFSSIVCCRFLEEKTRGRDNGQHETESSLFSSANSPSPTDLQTTHKSRSVLQYGTCNERAVRHQSKIIIISRVVRDGRFGAIIRNQFFRLVPR